VAELGTEGTVELFDLTRRLGHRMGLASWAGPGCAQGDTFDRLVRAFDVLDGSDAFVYPDAMAAVAASDKRTERAALDGIVEIVGKALHGFDPRYAETLFGRIVEAWSAEPSETRTRGIALDVALIHIASMWNLMAALGWAFVDLFEHPGHLHGVATATTIWRAVAHWRAPGWRSARSCHAPFWYASTSTPATRVTACPPAGPSPHCFRC
jgi:hypothetical protein